MICFFLAPIPSSNPPFHRRTRVSGQVVSFFFKPNQTKIDVHLFQTYIKYIPEYGMSYLSLGRARGVYIQRNKETELPITVPDRLGSRAGRKTTLMLKYPHYE